MNRQKITDWDDAYANGPNIPGGEKWPNAWIEPAREFRSTSKGELDISYGRHEREVYDLFMPNDEPRGLFVFVHGGFWLALDKSYWSHLANGAVQNGFAVAMPSYVLCPEVGIESIVQMIGSAIEHTAESILGPIILCGHSAGGHLVSSMVSEHSPLSDTTRQRIKHTISISGLHDLRPLLNTKMNENLRLSHADAIRLSPALQMPAIDGKVTAWVGSDERPEFIRQSELIENIWHGLGAQTQYFLEPNRHHFDVIDGLADPKSDLMNTALDF